MTQFGIMQGRLVPPDGGRFQSFPRERWADEFAFAASVPLSYIEWIYDAYGEDVNPLRTESGMQEIQRLMGITEVHLRALCADWFMDFPILRCSEADREFRQQFLCSLLRSASMIGVQRIILPFVDASCITTREDEELVVRMLEKALPTAEDVGVELHLETSLAPDEFRKLLDRLPHSKVKVNYDSGNSASLGYRPSEEFAAYGERVGSVHIKDRLLEGGTVPLGTGNADFEDLFASLKRVNYAGDFTMQVARGEPGEEVSLARQNLEIIHRYWAQWNPVKGG